MSIRYRPGMPTVVTDDRTLQTHTIPQEAVRSTLQQKKATGQSADPMAKRVNNQSQIAEHNRKVLAARAAQAKAREALATATAAVGVADTAEQQAEDEGEPAGADEFTVTSASASVPAATFPPTPAEVLPPQTPAASPIKPIPAAQGLASRPQASSPRQPHQGPPTNRVPGIPQPIGRSHP
jgi:hypothetical protein